MHNLFKNTNKMLHLLFHLFVYSYYGCGLTGVQLKYYFLTYFLAICGNLVFLVVSIICHQPSQDSEHI